MSKRLAIVRVEFRTPIGKLADAAVNEFSKDLDQQLHALAERADGQAPRTTRTGPPEGALGIESLVQWALEELSRPETLDALQDWLHWVQTAFKVYGLVPKTEKGEPAPVVIELEGESFELPEDAEALQNRIQQLQSGGI